MKFLFMVKGGNVSHLRGLSAPDFLIYRLILCSTL